MLTKSPRGGKKKTKSAIRYTWGIHSLTRKRLKTHVKKILNTRVKKRKSSKRSKKKRKSRTHKKRGL
tara:strand:- start:8325 stop:8525 length:201 start_codon:yes stop_codon:yes gene_type:complete